MADSPAALLRQAAELIRQRTALVPPSPWYAALHDVTTYDGLNVIASSGLTVRAQYVASWQPVVALAVADWLEAEADHADRLSHVNAHLLAGALAVARAYLDGAK
jgi:hypothetical protein